MAYNLEQVTKENVYYRRVLYTTTYQQLVLMSIKPGDYIPRELHDFNDQFIRIEEGKVQVTLNDNQVYTLGDGDSITIPAKTYHEVVNVGNVDLKLYTIYSPPHHKEGTLELENTDRN